MDLVKITNEITEKIIKQVLPKMRTEQIKSTISSVVYEAFIPHLNPAEQQSQVPNYTQNEKVILTLCSKLNKRNKIEFILNAADHVIHLFEGENPEDLRPRVAIDLAKEFLLDGIVEENHLNIVASDALSSSTGKSKTSASVANCAYAVASCLAYENSAEVTSAAINYANEAYDGDLLQILIPLGIELMKDNK